MREWTNWKDIGIQKNYFRKLSETESMKFREDRGEIGATWEERVLESAYLEGEEKERGRMQRVRGCDDMGAKR
jgi:hypothetical protein